MFVTHTRMLRSKGFRHSGTAVVELAVTLPLILSVLLGIINGGQLFWVRQVMDSASREGARAFMDRIPNPTKAQQTAEKFLGMKDASGNTVYFDATTKPSFIAGNGGQITITVNPTSSSSTQQQRTVTVQVQIARVLLTGNFLNLWNATKTISCSTTCRSQQ